MHTRVKICCIANPEEAHLAIEHGADAIGLVGQMPSGPGIISDAMASLIAKQTPASISTFLLTSETAANAIADHVLSVGANTVQIVWHIDPGESEKLAKLLPATSRVQVIHVEDESCLEQIETYKQHCDAFLLDSGSPNADIAELGGTGRTHDWSVSKRFVQQSPLPVFLAGGLNPQNIASAIRSIRPYGVDLCSGIRTEGKLDQAKLAAFMDEVKVADSG